MLLINLILLKRECCLRLDFDLHGGMPLLMTFGWAD